MTQERTDGATPNGGDYSVAVYVNLQTMDEVDKAVADGIVISEYTADGAFIGETVGGWAPPTGSASESPEQAFKRHGFTVDGSTDTDIVFLGPKGVAAAKKR